MTYRETLLKVLESAESAIYWNSSDKGFIEKVADHLIANGVTIPVRCRECKDLIPESITVCRHCALTGMQVVDEDDFCSYGERRTDE